LKLKVPDLKDFFDKSRDTVIKNEPVAKNSNYYMGTSRDIIKSCGLG